MKWFPLTTIGLAVVVVVQGFSFLAMSRMITESQELTRRALKTAETWKGVSDDSMRAAENWKAVSERFEAIAVQCHAEQPK